MAIIGDYNLARVQCVVGSFRVTGWAPEGEVHFQYAVTADDAGLGNGFVRYTAEAASDIDDDGVPAFFKYVKAAVGGGMAGSLPGTTCTGSGPLGQVVPCDGASGFSEF